MPFTPETKTPGDLIRSAEWNEAMDEIVRLDDDKLDVAGGAVQGDLATTGALGVGTTAPTNTDKLHVQGGSVAVERTADTVNAGDPRIPFLRLKDIDANDGQETLFTVDVAQGPGLTNLVAGAQVDPASNQHLYHSDRGASRILMDDGYMRFYIGATTGVAGQPVAWNECIRIASTGNVGIGTTATTAPLTLPGGSDVTETSGGALHIGSLSSRNLALDNNEVMARNNGVGATLYLKKNISVDTNITYGGSIGPSSSRTLKQDIADIPLADAIAALEQLQPASFRYKRDTDTKRLGFIVEDVPELVANGNRETVDLMNVIAVLTRVVKHQQEEIKALKERLEQS